MEECCAGAPGRRVFGDAELIKRARLKLPIVVDLYKELVGQGFAQRLQSSQEHPGADRSRGVQNQGAEFQGDQARSISAMWMMQALNGIKSILK